MHNFCVFFSDLEYVIESAFQLTFTCSKSEIETLEKGVKYFQK